MGNSSSGPGPGCCPRTAPQASGVRIRGASFPWTDLKHPPHPCHPGWWWDPDIFPQLVLFLLSFEFSAKALPIPAPPCSFSASYHLLEYVCYIAYASRGVMRHMTRAFFLRHPAFPAAFLPAFWYALFPAFSITAYPALSYFFICISYKYPCSMSFNHNYFLTFPMRHVIFSLLYIPILLLGVVSICIIAMLYLLTSYLTSFWISKWNYSIFNPERYPKRRNIEYIPGNGVLSWFWCWEDCY